MLGSCSPRAPGLRRVLPLLHSIHSRPGLGLSPPATSHEKTAVKSMAAGSVLSGCSFTELPVEILCDIFAYLDALDIVRCSAVSEICLCVMEANSV
jgi:hypothetical protein